MGHLTQKYSWTFNAVIFSYPEFKRDVSEF